MTGYTICAAVLLGALLPALALAAYGEPVARLVGLELVGSVVTAFMFVLAQITHQSYYLSVPLLLVPLSLAGILVFTRLLAPRGEEEDS
jgi:multisubunit Na+/H+ antiporter MnhF subunit